MSSALDRFTILQRLGTGGMAEVFKCRQHGMGGFEKLVVIKRILPHLVDNEAFVSMFLDEARIAANLSHANIVQVFEIEADPRGVPYIVMEYVRGPSLQQLIRQAHVQKKVDLRHLARLMEGASRGLHHAHLACDADGRPLNIVHRDISLQNILVTLTGEAKLADFGVAKADGRLTHTQSGVVKGKVRYTAPEVLVDPDNNVHHRSDVFGLGVCLYVATTGQYPFNGANDLAIMEAIHKAEHLKPSAHVPDYPKDLEAIVEWLLENDPRRRCPSALAAAERLRAWLSSHEGSPDAEVGAWVSSLCPPENAGDIIPPPPLEPSVAEKATPEHSNADVLDSVDIILASDAEGSRLAHGRSSKLWVLVVAVLLGLATAWAIFSARAQANEAAREAETRNALLDEADRQLAAGRFQHAEELLRRGASVPHARMEDELRVTKLEADLRFARSLAAAHAALNAGELESANALLRTLMHLEAEDARALALAKELKAVEAARAVAVAPQPVTPVEPTAVPALLDAGSAHRPTRRPKTAAPATQVVAGVEPAQEQVAEAGPVVSEPAPAAPPPPAQRPQVTVQRQKRDGKPGMQITSNVHAQVFLDGLPIGWTPLEVQEVTAATHLVMAWAEGYSSMTERVVVSPGEQVSLNFPLTSAPP